MNEINSDTIGVVSVTFNAEPFIQEFMHCCLAQTYANFKLLIIDNDSKDGSVAAVQRYNDPRIVVIVNSRNVGYAEACNQAIHYFTDNGIKEILFINNDTVFVDKLFSELHFARERYHADAVTPRITYASNQEKNWYAGGRFNYWRGFQGEHLGEGKLNDPNDTVPRFTPVASGCCVLFSLDVFKTVGNFDPSFFVYAEDTDIFIRMKRQGKTLLYHPGIVLAHKISLSTGGSQSDFSIHYYHRNQIYLIRKHLSLFWMPVQLLIIFAKAFLRFLLRMDTARQFRLRIKGVFYGFKV